MNPEKSWKIFAMAQLFIFLSAMGIVYSKHHARNVFIEVEQTHRTRDKLNNEWTQLLLEQSVWAQNARIENIARRDLKMINPSVSGIKLVQAQ